MYDIHDVYELKKIMLIFLTAHCIYVALGPYVVNWNRGDLSSIWFGESVMKH